MVIVLFVQLSTGNEALMPNTKMQVQGQTLKDLYKTLISIFTTMSDF